MDADLATKSSCEPLRYDVLLVVYVRIIECLSQIIGYSCIAAMEMLVTVL